MEMEFDAEPSLAIGYHKPAHRPSADDFVFDVIDEVLTEGMTSRLYSTLVTRQTHGSVGDVGYELSRRARAEPVRDRRDAAGPAHDG